MSNEDIYLREYVIRQEDINNYNKFEVYNYDLINSFKNSFGFRKLLLDIGIKDFCSCINETLFKTKKDNR